MSNLRNRFSLAVLAVLFPAAAFADLTGTLTVTANSRVSMDTGATVASGGDFLWSGTILTPQGKAIALNGATLGFSGATSYSAITQSLLQTFATLGNQSPISGLTTGSIVGYETNGGNFGKLLVSSVSGTSITYQYTTYGVSSTGSGAGNPTITGVQNNYSYIVAGLPNYGIAPGTLFIITGSNLANTTTAALQDPSKGIPTSLNGASISVTVGGVTTTPPIYYAVATQIGAVLPSNTPVGTGTITVTYNGTPSASAPITVLSSALGLDSYYGTGSGLGVATNPTTGALYNYTNSIPPGTTVVLWGSGLGSTGDSDTTNTSTPHAVSNPPTFYIGGIATTAAYAGRSAYPGVDQINIAIPSNAPTGCAVSVVAVSGNIVSNSITLPIGTGVCSDPVLGYNGTTLTSTTTGSGTYNLGSVGITQTTTPVVSGFGGETTGAVGVFEKVQYSGTSSNVSGITSLGSCTLSSYSLSSSTTTVTTTGLDAGTISIMGPTGTQTLTAQSIPTQPLGLYIGQLSNSFFPPTGGTFTFTGTGGKDIGAFTASIAYNNPLIWSNMSSITSVARASGQTVTWTGGATNSYLYIIGSSSNTTASASFVCYAPVSAGQFTVPSYILLALPPGNGSLSVENAVAGTFTASGLTTGVTSAGVSFSIAPTYN
jgi:uncharacterized protein (TIGR03437 family)